MVVAQINALERLVDQLNQADVWITGYDVMRCCCRPPEITFDGGLGAGARASRVAACHGYRLVRLSQAYDCDEGMDGLPFWAMEVDLG